MTPRLRKPTNHVTGADCGTDHAGHVGAHGVHQQEVLRVILGTFHLRNTCGHRHGGHACRTDERVHGVLRGAPVHDLREEEAGRGGETEGHNAHGDNHEGLRLQEDVGRHGETHGCSEENRHDVHELVGRGLHETFHHASFLEDVAQHEHDDKGRSVGHHQDADDHHHHGEHDAFGLAHLTESLHADLPFLVVGHEPHDRRLDERDKSHVGVGRHGNRSDEVLCKFVCSEDGSRTVGAADDTDGGRFTESKATESHGTEHGREHAELGATAEKQRAGVGDKRSKVRHGAHAQEDNGREQFQMDTLADVVVEAGSGREHAFDAPAAVVEPGTRDIHRQRAEGNRQEQQRLVLFDNRQVHQYETHDPHNHHGAGNVCESGVACELNDRI